MRINYRYLAEIFTVMTAASIIGGKMACDYKNNNPDVSLFDAIAAPLTPVARTQPNRGEMSSEIGTAVQRAYCDLTQ